MLISRTLAQWVCGIGLVQLFFATALTVCGFIALGLFHNVNGYGIWLGLPALIPGLVSVITLGTRQSSASGTVFLTSLIILGIGIWHSVEIYEKKDFWEKYRGYAEETPAKPLCTEQGRTVEDNLGNYHCYCANDPQEYNESGYVVQFCDEFRVGEDLFYAMFIFSIAVSVFSLLNSLLSIIACCICKPKELPPYQKNPPPGYYHSDDHKNIYAVSR
eukprot:TCONS_00059048-protein